MHNFYPDSDDRSFLSYIKILSFFKNLKGRLSKILLIPEYISRKKFLSIFIAIAPVNSLSQLLIEFQYMF